MTAPLALRQPRPTEPSPSSGSPLVYATPVEREALVEWATHERLLLVRVGDEADGDQDRVTRVTGGSLRDALDEAVEIALALRGALPPSSTAARDVQHDQRFRLAALGVPGLCILLPALHPHCEVRDGVPTLGAEDSAALIGWLESDVRATLVLHPEDGHTRVLRAEPLASLARADQPPTVRYGDDPPRPTEADEDALDLDDGRDDEFPFDWSSSEHLTLDVMPTGTLGRAEPVSARRAPDTAGRTEEEVPSPLPSPVETDLGANLRAALRIEEGPSSERPSWVGLDPSPDSVPPLDVRPVQGVGEWPSPAERLDYAEELRREAGPRPVRVVEELFRGRWSPLFEAISEGLEDPEVERSVDRWRDDFEASYHDGFHTMRLTGKRPAMVLDAPELASQLSRRHKARAVQLMLVDGLRFDLAQRVKTRLTRELAGYARCVEDLILWSALPTVTPVQMKLLATGPRGLREGVPTSDRDPIVQRDGRLSTLRRVRIGHRDLVKLDLVEARLRDPGAPYGPRLNALADEVAEVVAAFIESLPPRTMLFVFGDHGFHLPIMPDGTTGPAEQGGATPEEVLVNAQAWRVEDL